MAAIIIGTFVAVGLPVGAALAGAPVGIIVGLLALGSLCAACLVVNADDSFPGEVR